MDSKCFILIFGSFQYFAWLSLKPRSPLVLIEVKKGGICLGLVNVSIPRRDYKYKNIWVGGLSCLWLL